MQVAFKYRETTPFVGMESEPSPVQVSGIGALRIKGSSDWRTYFLKETDMNCVDNKICL